MLKPFYVVGVLLVTATFTFAQQVEEEDDTSSPPPPPPRPPPRAVVAATQAPRVPAPAQPQPAGPDNGVNLQFPNSDVADVLRFYEQLTGKKTVWDNFVQGKVNIFVQKKIPREEAIQIIEMNLLMNGFSLVPADNDIVKVIGTGKNPRTAGVPVISDETDIPAGEHVVSYLFKLRYADPTELQQVLSQYLSPPQQFTSFLALPKSGSLLVTENTAVIRKLVKIIDQVDIPPAEVVSEFIKLERADATKVVDLLKEVFEKAQPTGGPQPPPGGGVRGVRVAPIQPEKIESELGALTALTEDAIVVGKIKITADVRTNRIHVVTRPINMPFVRKLIGEFDANVEFAKPITRPLRYVSAGDVLPVLVQALTEPGTEGGGGAPGAGGLGGQQQQQQQQQQQRRNQQPNQPNQLGQTGSSGESTLNVSEELSTSPVDTTPKAVTIGNAKIIADQRANAIIILGNREVVVKVMKILDEMDVSSPQVALATVIGELTLNRDEEFGVDYFVRHRRGLDVAGTTKFTGVPPFAAGGSTPGPSASPGTGTTGGSIFDPANLISFSQLAQNAASGGNVYLAAGQTLAAVVHLLNSTGNFRTISRPMVFTSNNKKAIIASGTEIPVPVSTLSSVVANTGVNGTNIGQQSNIQFKKVALQLEVVPLINSEKEVSLDILQKLDSIAGSTTVDGNAIPNIATRYIRTTVTAPNRSTIVLGGLITDTKEKDYNGIPILDRIPLLGYLFRNTKETKARTELIILMRPEVTLTKADLYRLRQTTKEKMAVSKELDKQPPLNQGEEGEEYETSEKQLPPPDLPPARMK